MGHSERGPPAYNGGLGPPAGYTRAESLARGSKSEAEPQRGPGARRQGAKPPEAESFEAFAHLRRPKICCQYAKSV